MSCAEAQGSLLSDIENGNVKEIKLYEDDDLKDVAEGINNLIKKL